MAIVFHDNVIAFLQPEIWPDINTRNHNESTISKIKAFKFQGSEVKLFIGRDPRESLPEETNTAWVSLSHTPFAWVSQSLTENRLHLIVDCNENIQMQTIKGLFHCVVVDLSTRKFFYDNGLSNIYSSVQAGGTLLIEQSVFGGTLKIEDPMAFLSAKRTYNKEFEKFVTDFFQNRFHIILDMSQKKGHFMYEEQVLAQKDKMVQLPEYQLWKMTQDIDHKFNEMRYFFTHLAEQQNLVSPSTIISRQQDDQEKRTRIKEMSLIFDKVEFLHQVYPYKNNWDHDGKVHTHYFYATGKRG